MSNKSSFISPNARIDQSAYIGTNVRILGSTIIGPNCYIDDNVVLGYPSKEALREMIRNKSVPTDLSDLDKYSEEQTIVSSGCCIRFGSVVSVGTYIYDDAYCDVRTQIGAYCKIGERTHLMYGARVYNNVTIGADCRVGGFCCNRSVIEDKASMFGELVHAYRNPVGGLIEASPIVRRGATVGWHAIIIGGIEIGEDSYIAAGATVTKNVPRNHVVAGLEAKAIPVSEWKGSLSKPDIAD